VINVTGNFLNRILELLSTVDTVSARHFKISNIIDNRYFYNNFQTDEQLYVALSRVRSFDSLSTMSEKNPEIDNCEFRETFDKE
jgi:hypothetical protein